MEKNKKKMRLNRIRNTVKGNLKKEGFIDEEEEFEGEGEPSVDDSDSFEEGMDFGDDNIFDGQDGEDFYGAEGDQSPLQKHSDLLKDLTNYSPYLKETFNNWLGLTWDEETGSYKQNPLIKPVMSYQGVAWGVGFLKTYTRSNNIITDISHEEYKNIILDIIDTIWLNFGTRDDLGIKEDGDLLRVCNELEHAASLVLMGAGDGKYNAFLGSTITRHENINPNAINNQQNQAIVTKGNSGFLDRLRKKLLGDT